MFVKRWKHSNIHLIRKDMKLYIRFGSLAKFQRLFDSNEYLQVILSQTRSNVYFIETDDLSELKRLLNGNNIKFNIKDTTQL